MYESTKARSLAIVPNAAHNKQGQRLVRRPPDVDTGLHRKVHINHGRKMKESLIPLLCSGVFFLCHVCIPCNNRSVNKGGCLQHDQGSFSREGEHGTGCCPHRPSASPNNPSAELLSQIDVLRYAIVPNDRHEAKHPLPTARDNVCTGQRSPWEILPIRGLIPLEHPRAKAGVSGEGPAAQGCTACPEPPRPHTGTNARKEFQKSQSLLQKWRR